MTSETLTSTINTLPVTGGQMQRALSALPRTQSSDDPGAANEGATNEMAAHLIALRPHMPGVDADTLVAVCVRLAALAYALHQAPEHGITPMRRPDGTVYVDTNLLQAAAESDVVDAAGMLTFDVPALFARARDLARAS